MREIGGETIITTPVRLKWSVRRKKKNPAPYYATQRAYLMGIDSANHHTDRPVELLLDPARLDHAAAWLATAMRRPNGLCIWGRSEVIMTLRPVCPLQIPALYVDDPRTPTRWLNDLVNEWRFGTPCRPPLTHVAISLGRNAEWTSL